MSTRVASASEPLPAESTALPAARFLSLGLAGTAVTALGLLFSDKHIIAASWLVGIAFWTAMAIGSLFMVLIHHITDASWSVAIRRQYEHGLVAFVWIGLMFLPLVAASWLGHHDIVWAWMNPDHVLAGGKTVSADMLYQKKSSFLNLHSFTVMSVAFFGIWIGLSAALRKASFRQDADGSVAWTVRNRYLSALGIPLTALSLTAAAIYWFKSLEYHWFSTMYGVWYFSDCMRGALCLGVLIMVWLYNRGDYKGILNRNHMHSIGQLMLTFTVFWAYISFDQYFLIWNANVPEETFWYNIREYGDWWYVSLFLVFGNFLLPFCLLLSYRFKVVHKTAVRISWLILVVIFVDVDYNILPALKDGHGNPLPFFSMSLLWSLTSVVGVGGVCVWAYLRSFQKTKLLPIRDPRIGECLTHHE